MSIQASNQSTSPVDRSGAALQVSAQSTKAIFTFFALAFAWSWSIGLGAQYVMAYSAIAGTILAMISGFGPSLAAIAVVALFSNGAGLKDWLICCLNWRISWRWYAVAFWLPPAMMLLALAIHGALGGPVPASPALGQLPLAIANFGLVLLVGGPLGEEFGWRGYALPALATRLNWRIGSVLVGLIWGLWHLPLFFIASTPQVHMPILWFLASTTAQSVMFAWLLNNSCQSIVPALVMHTSINAWINVIPVIPTSGDMRPFALLIGIQVLIALALLITPDTRPAAGTA
jgi:membrane protease YdiL (CAAX protease family)